MYANVHYMNTTSFKAKFAKSIGKFKMRKSPMFCCKQTLNLSFKCIIILQFVSNALLFDGHLL